MINYPLDNIGHFRIARLTSYLSEGYPHPSKKLGAVISKGNKILSIGCNSYTKTHTLQGKGLKPYLHAEISALIRRRHYDDLSSCSITVYRESKNLPVMAKPCKQCMLLLREFGIKKVYYLVPQEPFFEMIKI